MRVCGVPGEVIIEQITSYLKEDLEAAKKEKQEASENEVVSAHRLQQGKAQACWFWFCATAPRGEESHTVSEFWLSGALKEEEGKKDRRRKKD